MSILRKMWPSNAKHKKLSEEWALSGPECGWMAGSGADERRFAVKYAGAAPAERAHSGPATAAAVRAAISNHKTSGKKMRRVIVNVSSAGIVVTDKDTTETLMDFSIFRISYCSADGSVFAFVACSEEAAVAGGLGIGEGPLECHAFSCTKRKNARAVSLCVAHAFNAAYQSWQAAQENRRLLWRSTAGSRAPQVHKGRHLPSPPATLTVNMPWVCFDDSDSDSDDRTPSPDTRDMAMPLINLEVF